MKKNDIVNMIQIDTNRNFQCASSYFKVIDIKATIATATDNLLPTIGKCQRKYTKTGF